MPRRPIMLRIGFGLFSLAAFCVAHAARAEPDSPSSNQATSPAAAQESPTLARIIAAARERHPEVLVARAQLDASRSVLVGASLPSLGNPHLEVVAGRGNQGVTRDVEVRSSLALPVEIAGQRGRRIAEGEAFISLHFTLLDQVRAMAAGAAVRAWGAAVGETARLEALQDLSRIAEDEYRILEARRVAGDATEQDVQLAALEMGRHHMLVAEAQASLVRALGELLRVTGIEWGKFGDFKLRAPTERIVAGARVPQAGQLPGVRSYRAEAEFHGKTADRYSREGWSPLNIIMNGGRGDFGESRFGVGVGMNLPIFRRFQGERARAEGDRNRSSTQAEVHAQVTTLRLETIRREVTQTRRALDTLESATMPAAKAALAAASDLRRAGKSDYLPVLIARREVTSLSLRRIDLSEREWDLLAEWVEFTGALP